MLEKEPFLIGRIGKAIFLNEIFEKKFSVMIWYFHPYQFPLFFVTTYLSFNVKKKRNENTWQLSERLMGTEKKNITNIFFIINSLYVMEKYWRKH